MNRRHFLVGLLPGALSAQRTKDLNITPEPASVAKQPVSSGRRLALVAGNNAYRFAPALHNAVADANDFSTALKRARFAVTTLTDGTEAAMLAGVRDFVSGVRPGDAVLFFYSGHGLQIGGENYVVPVDFRPQNESHARQHCLRVVEAQQQFEKAGAGLVILVLDACRSNPFNKNLVPARGLALMDGGLGCFIALSAGPGQTADDNSGGHNGLFTQHLLAEMERPGQPIDLLFRSVKKRVFDASSGQQRPWMHSDIVGDFVFLAAAGGSGSSDSPAGNRASELIRAGQLQFQTGDFEQAAQSFERAMRIDPSDAFVYNALGATYGRLKKWSLAVGLYSKAIELKPDYSTAYFNRGVAYANAARYDLALQDFSWALDEEPYDPLVLDARGRAYLAQLEYARALEDFGRALELDPWDSVALLGRGKVFFRQGRMAEALSELTGAIDVRPTAEAFESRAQVYRAMGQASRAEVDLREARLLNTR